MNIRKYIIAGVVATTLGLGGGALYLHQLNKSRVNPILYTSQSESKNLEGAVAETQESTSEHKLSSLEDYVALRLIDNASNKVTFRTGARYEEIYLAFCEGGTDGKGKIITLCTPDRRIDPKIFPAAIIFRNVSTDDNDLNIQTYQGDIPNIPGTEEATSIMIGSKKYNNIPLLEDMPEFSATVQNTKPKSRTQLKRVQPKKPEERKRGIIRRIFPRKN